MKTITVIGLDIAKAVFQVHGVDAEGKVAIRRQLKRARVLPFFAKLPLCVVGIEACASSHYWARELTALGSASMKSNIRPIDLRRMAAAIARSHGGSGAIAVGDARSAVRCCSLFIWAQGKFCLKRRRLRRIDPALRARLITSSRS